MFERNPLAVNGSPSNTGQSNLDRREGGNSIADSFDV